MALENDEIAMQVKKLVSYNRCIPVEKLNWDDTLYQDLCMFGDDASEFLEEFCKKFDVDMTGFRFDTYFRYEGCINPIEYTGAIFSNAFRLSQHYIPVTIMDLVNIAKRKSWKEFKEPVI